MILAYAFIGVLLGLPLIVFTGVICGVGGFIHGRINRWRRRRLRRKFANQRLLDAAAYKEWVRSQR